jgi:hypothetical protein
MNHDASASSHRGAGTFFDDPSGVHSGDQGGGAAYATLRLSDEGVFEIDARVFNAHENVSLIVSRQFNVVDPS